MIFQGRISELTIKEWRRACVRVAIFASLLGAASTAFAQSDAPEDAHVFWESLAVVPTLQLADVGWDNNVLRLAKASNPPDDLTATFSPDVQAWLRLPKVKMRGRSDVDFVYFKEFSKFRSVDTNNAGQIELLLGRLTPHAEGAWINAQHRNFEIDIPVRRLDSVWGGGLDVRVSGKTSLGILARRSRVDYKGDTVYLDSDLARYLDAVASAEGLRFRFAATPFTTVGVDVEQYSNRLSRAPERNSDGNLVAATFEFDARAQLSGSAKVGLTRRTFVDGASPPFQGVVARADLTYVLLGQTRFTLGLQRDLSLSFRADERDYLETSVRLSVTHRLAGGWDVGGSFGRFRLGYGLGESSSSGTQVADDETGVGYSVDLGYQLSRSRFGVQAARQTRSSEFSTFRDYEQTRIVSTVTYRF